MAKIIPPLKKYTQTIEKVIGYYLWRSHGLRVSREQLRLPCIKGGLGLADVHRKCCALIVKQIHTVMSCTQEIFQIEIAKQTKTHVLLREYYKLEEDISNQGSENFGHTKNIRTC